ncbi:nitrite reductase small subunit NirD [uncultured Thiohalocapsa sp.]|uniref:nitrite reductase small subunit NirD n=1 Tax=uncultured Thiohalocapsa sp. TaxID=768990 RepID=UPI0025E75498|nr:nitrite reductase small subunit NirD [uncultured Thiohalocapsa sp.]
MSAVMAEHTWVDIGPIASIPRLGARVLKRNGVDIAVFRNAEDEVFALLNRCPHKGGPLSEGIVYGRTVACPLHNLCMDLATGQAQAPDEGRAATFAVRIDGDRVLVSMTPV